MPPRVPVMLWVNGASAGESLPCLSTGPGLSFEILGLEPGVHTPVRYISLVERMRTPLLTIFEDTLNRCFSTTLQATLGGPVRDEIYRVLAKKGISGPLVANMFDEVVAILMEAFGDGYRMLIHRTIVELYKEYSQRIDFSYQESLRNHISFLRDRVVSDHLYPRGWRSDPLDSFFDQPRRPASQGSL